jgi:hypothetical protein
MQHQATHSFFKLRSLQLGKWVGSVVAKARARYGRNARPARAIGACLFLHFIASEDYTLTTTPNPELLTESMDDSINDAPTTLADEGNNTSKPKDY